MYAVLNCAKLLTTQVNYETAFTGTFGPLVQHTLMKLLICNSISIIETARVTESPTVPCIEKPVSEISLIGEDTLLRAQL